MWVDVSGSVVFGKGTAYYSKTVFINTIIDSLIEKVPSYFASLVWSNHIINTVICKI